MSHQQEAGMKAEHYFISRLNENGIPYEFIDDWFDFKALDEKIEVKSCRISVKQNMKKKEQYRVGRFDFTDESNRENQFNENVWVCFIVRHEDQFMIMGFVKARQLKMKRYITLHKLRDLNLLNLEDWIKKHNKNA